MRLPLRARWALWRSGIPVDALAPAVEAIVEMAAEERRAPAQVRHAVMLASSLGMPPELMQLTVRDNAPAGYNPIHLVHAIKALHSAILGLYQESKTGDVPLSVHLAIKDEARRIIAEEVES